MNKMNTKGFTIIELLIAMSAFTAMVLIASLTTLQIGKMYYKGIYSSRTQETARTTMAIVSESVQFGSGEINNPASVWEHQVDSNDLNTKFKVYAKCIGTNRYTYAINRRLTPDVSSNVQDRQLRHVLWKDNSADTACTPADLSQTTPSVSGVAVPGIELLGENMRLSSFDIVPDASDKSRVRINLGIIYGDQDLVEEVDQDTVVGCRGGIIGSQWCASSKLETEVFRRIKAPE